MIKAIIFDCFGVLTTDTWRAFMNTLPATVDIERVRELNRQRDSGLLEESAFLRQIQELTGRRPEQVEEQLAGEVTKNTVLLEYIKTELKPKYAIGLLSNIASNWIRDSFLSVTEQALFDEMVFSYEVGFTKPDPRIFMLMCERLRVGPHEAVLIDDVDLYCQAAQKEGLQTIVYADFQQFTQEINTILYSS